MTADQILSTLRFGAEPGGGNDVFTANIQCDEPDPKVFLKCVGERLRFPAYYGVNWNAFEECLNDMSWIPEKVVLMLHDGLPKMAMDQLGIYLDIVSLAILNWKTNGGHELIAIFPAAAEVEIDKALAGHSIPVRHRLS